MAILRRGRTRFNEADEDLIDLVAQAVREGDDCGDVREFSGCGCSKDFVKLIEALSSGDNCLTGVGKRLVSIDDPFGGY